MTEDQNLNLVFAIGALVLVISALFSYRIGFGQLVRTALSWVAIFAIFIVIFSYQKELTGVWNKVTGELTGSNNQQIVGQTLRLRQSLDGHFWADAMVNGTPVRFLIDSGATTTAMTLKTAQATNVEIDTGGFPVYLNTANGTVEAQRGTIQSLQVGPMKALDFPVVVAEAFGGSNVLGMNFLSGMKSWRVEGMEMILEPPNSANAQ
ncbi:TIGR02281 family clan AA aspartic protease [Parasphingorhabdus sp. JC815]|uniref:retropepsin-like aspartic protease family protein n=1 Tax=Parasphingorhabdus sp. JC815 TaxID=3232140 RepID=UPI00345768A9